MAPPTVTRRQALASLSAVGAAPAFDFIHPRRHAAVLQGRPCEVAADLQSGLHKAGRLHLPAGLYVLDGTLEVPSGGGLIGEGYAAVVRAAPDFGDAPLVRNAGYRAATAAERDRDLVFTGVKLDG